MICAMLVKGFAKITSFLVSYFKSKNKNQLLQALG